MQKNMSPRRDSVLYTFAKNTAKKTIIMKKMRL